MSAPKPGPEQRTPPAVTPPEAPAPRKTKMPQKAAPQRRSPSRRPARQHKRRSAQRKRTPSKPEAAQAPPPSAAPTSAAMKDPMLTQGAQPSEPGPPAPKVSQTVSSYTPVDAPLAEPEVDEPPLPEIEPLDPYYQAPSTYDAPIPYEEELDDDFDEEDDLDLLPEVEHVSLLRRYAGWLITIAVALLAAFLIRQFMLHAFYVEYDSMLPTLEPNDRILVNKLDKSPSRFDLIVFSRSNGDLIKRAVALEGETIYFERGTFRIGEDQWAQEPYLSQAGITRPSSSVIPGCDEVTSREPDGTWCKVPEGHVFVLGDNRQDSQDSRNFGPVPHEDIIGTAVFQIWPLGDMGTL